MKFIRNSVVLILSLILIVLQGGYVKAEETDKLSAKIGDKYEKNIVVVGDDEADLKNATSKIFIAPKFLADLNDVNEGTEVKTEQLLVPKTDAKYEVALAYEDGDYTYAGKADTYEEAVKKANEEDKKIKNVTAEFVVPVVLSTAQGTIDYAAYGIGRCIKYYKEGEKDPNYNVSAIFKDADLTSVDRYINQNCCSEMPLLEERENEAKIYINGCSGWMNRNSKRYAGNENGKRSSDVSIYPVNQVTNPSFYYAGNDGLLYHYISSSMMTNEVKIGSYTDQYESKKIGKAPSYLEKNVKYLSYDGIHFYTTKNVGIPRALYLVTEDLKAGNFNNSVNPNNPYYNYYLYLPFRSRTNYTAEELDKYIDYYIAETGKSNSKLKGIGKTLIEDQNKYGVNALLTLGIAINESDGGTSSYALSKNNLFGLDATDYNSDSNVASFKSVDECVEEFCKTYISKWFADVNNYSFYGDFLGNKGYGANVKYASDPYWADKAANNACKIENYLNDKDISKYRDYDYYQLFRFTKAGSVKNIGNNTEYIVNSQFIPQSGEFVGATGILLCNNTFNLGGTICNEIALDRTLQADNKNNGLYNWSTKGYIDKNFIELINKGKTNVDKADVNKDGKIDEVDLAKVAASYNNDDYNLDYMCDLNNDGIVDIYDIVKISSRL